MKIAPHMAVAFTLIFTLVSGLCMNCARAGVEHKCCRETETAPSCHQPEPSEKEQCDCRDTGRILKAAVEAKQTVKQQSQPIAVPGFADVPGGGAVAHRAVHIEIDDPIGADFERRRAS